MPTIKDIAQIAGVSSTTVTNVIHGNTKRVSPGMIDQINSIIKNLNYVPNMSARSLVSRSSMVIGYIYQHDYNKVENFIEDPFHSAFLNAIESKIHDNGYYLMIRTIKNSEDITAFMHNWNVDGLILSGIFQDDFFNTLVTLPVPIVLIDSYVNHPSICNVGLEDFKACYNSTKYLIDLGHKNIAFVSPPMRDSGVIYERFSGYVQALREANLPFYQDYIYHADISVDAAYALGQTISKRSDITGIITTADVLAAGIMAGIRNEGKSIPKDFSIIGFDDLSISRITYPPLTTIHQDTHQKGVLALDFLFKKIKNEPIENPIIVLPTYLVERDSVRPINEF